MKSFKNLNTLKSYLQIEPINTGEQFTRLGFEYTTDEGLHAMTSVDGSCVHLRSGVEWALEEYRGQVRDYGGCFSGLDRCTNDVDLFDALLRNRVFEQGLEAHPALLHMQSVTLFEKPFCINKQGVAQHYGLATDYVDITPNFDVASFFATQKWNAKQQRYEPMKASWQPGVLYKIIPAMVMLPENGQSPAYTPIGWQPFERPEQQRANAYRLAFGEDFAKVAPVTKFRFKQDWTVSKQIYEQFEGGDVLFPVDSLADFAEQVKALNLFTPTQLNNAMSKFTGRTGKLLDLATAKVFLKQKGGRVSEDVLGLSQLYHLNFNEQAFEQKLLELKPRIKYRRTIAI